MISEISTGDFSWPFEISWTEDYKMLHSCTQKNLLNMLCTVMPHHAKSRNESILAEECIRGHLGDRNIGMHQSWCFVLAKKGGGFFFKLQKDVAVTQVSSLFNTNRNCVCKMWWWVKKVRLLCYIRAFLRNTNAWRQEKYSFLSDTFKKPTNTKIQIEL